MVLVHFEILWSLIVCKYKNSEHMAQITAGPIALNCIKLTFRLLPIAPQSNHEMPFIDNIGKTLIL